MKPPRLFIPGPIDVDVDVMREMASPQIPHYSEEAIGCYHECIEKLRGVLGCGQDDEFFLMNGSGNVAIDAAIGSTLRTGDKAIVGVNGFFGQRMTQIARSYGIEVVEVKVPAGHAIKAQHVDRALRENGDVKAICLVHLETSTGVLNPVGEIGTLAHEKDLPFIVDAVSSAGVDEFLMDEWNVSICGTSTQKGLESPPGLGIVVVSPTGWRTIEEKAITDHGWYSSLSLWREKARTEYKGEATIHPCLVTMAVNNVKALRKSLEQIHGEGVHERFARHKRIAGIVRNGLVNLGFRIFPETGYSSNGVTVVENALNVEVEDLIRFLRLTYNIEVSNGIGELNNRIMRIGHMGSNASLEAVVVLLFGIEHYLRSVGMAIPVGRSLVAVG